MGNEGLFERFVSAVERIAAALEKGKATNVDIPQLGAQGPAAQLMAAQLMAPQPPTPAAAAPEVKTTDELKAFAKKVVDAAGDKNAVAVEAIKGICAKYAPATPKLSAVPVEKIPEAAKLIKEYAEKNGIKIG